MPRNLQPPRSSKTQPSDRVLHVSRKLIRVPKFKVVPDANGDLQRVQDGFDFVPAKRGKTFNDGRNARKREARAKSAALRRRVSGAVQCQ